MKIPAGMKVDDIVVGTGRVAEQHSRALVHYECFVHGGQRLFSTHDCSALTLVQCGESCPSRHPPVTIQIGKRRGYPALYYGVLGMRVGGIRRVLVEPHLSKWERRGKPNVPYDALLDYQVELLQVNDEPEHDGTRRKKQTARALKNVARRKGHDA